MIQKLILLLPGKVILLRCFTNNAIPTRLLLKEVASEICAINLHVVVIRSLNDLLRPNFIKRARESSFRISFRV